MAEDGPGLVASEPGGAFDFRATELASRAVFHREEWTPGLGGDGSEPASKGSIGALVCSVSMELSQAAAYLGIWEGDITPRDVGDLPIDAMPHRISLLFARAAAACVCAIAELHTEMIEGYPNRMARRSAILDVLDGRIFDVVEDGAALPGGLTEKDDELDLDPNAWLRGALSLLGLTAGFVANAYGVSPLPAGETPDMNLVNKSRRAFLLMRRRLDIAASLEDVAIVCALAAAWFERNADELERRRENLIDFGD